MTSPEYIRQLDEGKFNFYENCIMYDSLNGLYAMAQLIEALRYKPE
jgi:hypothetical protein